MRLLLIVCLSLAALSARAEEITLLNASYDPTRELYADYNRLFVNEWKQKTGEELRIRMSHAGSGAQARSVMEGLPADVATLALGYDIDAIAGKGKIAKDWQNRLPHNSSPYRSIVVFLVREGNPKNIRDWDDLAKDDVRILTPNPKTSGGARWNYLAAWAWAEKHFDSEEKRDGYMRTLLSHVLMFDTGARAATTNFVRRRQGDVLITWENEAHVAQHYFGDNAFEIIIPSTTILAEPTITMVDSVVDARNTRPLAEAYLKGLYELDAQRMIAAHYFRPVDETVHSPLPALTGIKVKTISDFGGWANAQKTHFADGGSFDRLSLR